MKKWFLAVIIPIFLVLLNYRLLVFNDSYYFDEFKELGVYDKFSKKDVEENTFELIGYFKGKNALESEFFNEKEKLHLKDVKNLIKKTNIIFWISATLLGLLVFLNRNSLSKPFFYGGILMIVVIFIFSMINFNFLFLKFHELSFNNTLWILDEDDNLINLFPEKFFQDFVEKIFLNSFIISILLIISSFFLRKFE